MLAFAIVFSLTVESSVAGAFIGASFAWLVVSVAAWYVRRKMRLGAEGADSKKSAAPRFREAATVDPGKHVRPRSKRKPRPAERDRELIAEGKF